MCKDFSNCILSVDAECDGLSGGAAPLALGAVLYDLTSKNVIDTFVGRVADLGGVRSQWVVDNVLPAIEAITNVYHSSDDLSREFALWYKSKNGALVIAHVPHPVETTLFASLAKHGLIGECEQPYPLIDVASMLHLGGENPLTVDGYIKKYGLADRFPHVDVDEHHPLHDAYQALTAYLHLTGQDIRQLTNPSISKCRFNGIWYG